jgi:ribosomal protein S20
MRWNQNIYEMLANNKKTNPQQQLTSNNTTQKISLKQHVKHGNAAARRASRLAPHLTPSTFRSRQTQLKKQFSCDL